jgi:hypothetical protein
MEFTLCLNDHDISVLRMAIDDRCSQLCDEMRELKRISEDEEIPDLEEQLRDLRAADTKLAAACSPVGGM